MLVLMRVLASYKPAFSIRQKKTETNQMGLKAFCRKGIWKLRTPTLEVVFGFEKSRTRFFFFPCELELLWFESQIETAQIKRAPSFDHFSLVKIRVLSVGHLFHVTKSEELFAPTVSHVNRQGT